MNSAIKSINIILLLMAMILGIGFAYSFILLNKHNFEEKVLASYQLSANNTAKTISYSAKIGDLNNIQSRLIDLSSLLGDAVITYFDQNENEVSRVPAFIDNNQYASKCKNKAIVSNIVYNSEMIGKIKVCLPETEKELNSKDLFAIIFFIFLFGVIFLSISQIIYKRINESKILFDRIVALNPENDEKISTEGISQVEILPIIESINYVLFKIKRYENELSNAKIQAGMIAISKQVAHDIRSPLSALNIITSTLTDVSEEKRLLIRNSVQRINDIANDLLQKGKSAASKSTGLGNGSASGVTSSDLANNNADGINISENNHSVKQNYCFLLSTVVDNIASEKRIQFREKININIYADLKKSFGLFVNANPNELSRVISNLINNSIEALPNQAGNIDVTAFTNSDSKICIQIKDNGSGIPKHILEKLGQAGITHGKENTQSGSGLGVYHAVKTIQEFGGKIIFQSITSEDLPAVESTTFTNALNVPKSEFNSDSINKTGTTITIELPKAETPTWFAESIQLKPGQEIVTVDDDISIHQIWKGRLESLKANEQNIKLTSFTSAKEFREYFNKNLKSVFNTSNESTGINSDEYSGPDSTVVFLIDYEFLNQNDNGLKIITDLGIQEKAILVTSRFDEPNIRSECEAQKIKILPKQLAGQITISIAPSSGHSSNEIVLFANTDLSKAESTINNQPVSMKLSKYDLCLIDDDKLLVHSIWGMVAKEKGLNIRMFERPEDFLSEAGSIDKTTPLYVDVSLGNNVNGIDVAKAIHEQGFENINLATGYDSETIKVPSFIRQVVGKDCPL